ncbi:MAG: glycosyltransferase family 4 protein, partial [Flavobacteriales bacterium]
YPGHYLNESYAYSCRLYDRLKGHANEFDFIYAKGFCAWKWLEEKSKGKSLPCIGVKFHGYEMFQPPANWRMKLQNWLLQSPTRWNNQHADVIFSYGGDITRIIRGIAPERTILEVPTGITAEWIRKEVTQHKKRNWVFLGRFERRKGIEELQQAWQAIQEDDGVHLHLIGPIPHSKRIKAKNVTYHGGISNPKEIREILDQCEALIAPSHSEGMPNAIMEAMARGLAILTTPVGAIPSMVDEKNGAFVQPADVQDLERNLRAWMNLPSGEMLAMQQASLDRVNSFRWPMIAQRTADAISDYLARGEST